MGGAINYRDPTRAEHNFRLDTHGARAVLATMPHVRLVIFDTTFTDELAISAQSPLYKRLAARDPPPWANLLRTQLDRWFTRFHPSALQHDALTLSAAIDLPFVRFTRAPIALDQHGRMSSQTEAFRLDQHSRVTPRL